VGRVDPDSIDRVVKLLADSDPTLTFDTAAELLRTYRLQMTLGSDAAGDPAWQAAALTAVNVGVRAVHGGVRVALAKNGPCLVPWSSGRDLARALEDLGGEVVASAGALDAGVPTIAFGEGATLPPSAPLGAPRLRAFAHQWVAGVAPDGAELDAPAGAPPSALAGVLVGALGVAECFQWLRGHRVAGDRVARVSLWDPEGGRDGPAIAELPAELWLLGLGHLGQAYAWLLTMLPYPTHGTRPIVLHDDDRLSPANRATSMLHREQALGMRKARLAAGVLEPLGWDAALMERRFGGGRLHDAGDPRVLLGGVDNPEARRGFDDSGFSVIVDAGLGAGPDGFLAMTIRRLPGERSAHAIWPASARSQSARPQGAAYAALEAETGDRCGVELLAGRTVATAFVGVTAACWVIGGLMRELHAGPAFALVDHSLRDPNRVLTITAAGVRPPRIASVACVR
jgi:hypothetical protein